MRTPPGFWVAAAAYVATTVAAAASLGHVLSGVLA